MLALLPSPLSLSSTASQDGGLDTQSMNLQLPVPTLPSLLKPVKDIFFNIFFFNINGRGREVTDYDKDARGKSWRRESLRPAEPTLLLQMTS